MGSVGGPVVTVGALVQNAAGEVLLLRTHKWRGQYGIPSGKVRRGETLEAALRREIAEETGLAVEAPRLLLVQELIEHPGFHRPAHFVSLNHVCRARGVEVVLNDESEAFLWAAPRRALDLDVNEPTRALLRRLLEEER